MPLCRITLSGVFMLVSTAGIALAETPKPNISELVNAKTVKAMHDFIETDIVRISVESQNQRMPTLDQATIANLDNQWKKERESADKPLIAATLSSPLSVYLSRIQGQSLGLYAEIFVMDHNGLNVGQSSITSDFWQGDEAKFQKTFDIARDAMFVDEAEWDDDAKIWRGQVSFTLTDEGGKNKIGAVTVELNLTELERRLNTGS